MLNRCLVCGFHQYGQIPGLRVHSLYQVCLYLALETRPLSLIAMCQGNLSRALASQQSTPRHGVNWNCAPVSLQDHICSHSLWLSPYQLSKPHLLSYPVTSIPLTCGAPVWQSMLVRWPHTKTLLLMMILTCHLMFSISYKYMRRTRWGF